MCMQQAQHQKWCAWIRGHRNNSLHIVLRKLPPSFITMQTATIIENFAEKINRDEKRGEKKTKY